MSCTNRHVEPKESSLVSTEKGVQTKMSNQRWLVDDLSRQETSQRD